MSTTVHPVHSVHQWTKWTAVIYPSNENLYLCIESMTSLLMHYRKYIFLDFDGTLNTGRGEFMNPDRYGHHFDNIAVRNLRRIVEKTGAQIVVSSSWRHLGLEKIREVWTSWGLPGEIVGCTPGVWGDGRIFDTRGEEIQQWLDENVVDDYAYVVIDDMDDSEAIEGQEDNWIEVDPHCGISYDDADYAIKVLNKDDPEIRAKKRKRMKIVLLVLAALVVLKVLWVVIATLNIGSFKSEKSALLRRRNYLQEKVITGPQMLIDRVPAAVGPQFQGEWALYSCSMLSASLVNMAQLYPETREDAVIHIDSLIKIVMSPELRRYDLERWGEDPLTSLDGEKSHISYLSHLAWMIAGYKHAGGDGRYDKLYHSLCATMNRRLLASPGLNLQTYPGEYVYIPDMLVAIVALKLYSQEYGGKYGSTVNKWLENMKKNHLSESSGIIASMVMYDYDGPSCVTVKGSYTALSCYYLSYVDEDFARDQYDKFKTRFLKKWPLTGFKEYEHKSPILGMDIDAGPIVFGLSPSGTAFGLGPATYLGDSKVRKKILHTAEIAGTTVTFGHKSHYLLADVALVGEAIALAMRTAVKWE